MPPPSDVIWAQRLCDPTDAEAWAHVVDLTKTIASQQVHGGSRFDADDVADTALERLVHHADRDLQVVFRGDLSLAALVYRFVRNAYCDLSKKHKHSARERHGESVEGHSAPVGHVAVTTQLWRAWLATADQPLAYQEALVLIHHLGPAWGWSAPLYPVLLWSEWRTWSQVIRILVDHRYVAGAPLNAAAQVVSWPPAIGAMLIGRLSLDAVVALGPDATDEQVSTAAGCPSKNALQQWRSRAIARVIETQDPEWVSDHLPHWIIPPVRASAQHRKDGQT